MVCTIIAGYKCRFEKKTMVCRWMLNGNIVEYVCNDAGDHPKLVGRTVQNASLPLNLRLDFSLLVVVPHISLFRLLSAFQHADTVEGLSHV